MLHILGNQTQFKKNCGSSYEMCAFIPPGIEREKKKIYFSSSDEYNII
jgi:hypothetical protein